MFAVVSPAMAADGARGGPLQIVTVGPDTNCDENDLQSAINNAADNTELRLQAGTFTGNFDIFGTDLTIRGGYLDCDDANPGGSSTLDAADSGRPLLVGSSNSSSEVYLENLFIENGSVADDGGGIEIDGSDAHHEVTLDNVTVRFNHADGYGGGVFMTGDSDMRLRLTGSTTILGNDAGVAGSNGAGEGGGIYCRGVGSAGFIQFEDGLVSLNSSVNTGGGISLQGCNLFMDSDAQVAFNDAGSVGGGIAAKLDSDVTVSGGGSDSIVNNSASADGGGVFAADDATLDLRDAVIRDNSADAGGGLFMRDNAVLTMGQSGSAPCSASACSTLRDNSATAGGGLLMSGGTASITRTRIEGNSATGNGSVASLVGGASLRIESSVVYENPGLDLFRLAIDGELEIAWSTVADNAAESGSPEIIRLTPDDVTTTALRLVSSIFWNPGRDVLLLNDGLGSNYSAEYDCLVSNELATLSGFTRSVVDDPLFVDPGDDDYHLQSMSPAIDACDDTNAPTVADIDGDSRGRDIGAPSMLVFDIGADESGLFSDRFEQ